MAQEDHSSRDDDGSDRPGGPDRPDGSHRPNGSDSPPPGEPGGPETHPPEDPTGPGEPDADSPEDIHGSEDATLGGYFRTHNRPPAFEGLDGHPYTVSIEVEQTPDLRAPWHAFLVFPRWAETGVGIVGHAETPILWKGNSRENVVREAGTISLFRVKELLDEAIRRKEALEGE